jgi:hypothetical protein
MKLLPISFLFLQICEILLINKSVKSKTKKTADTLNRLMKAYLQQLCPTPQPLRCATKSGLLAQRSGHPLFWKPISDSDRAILLAPAQRKNRYAAIFLRFRYTIA